MENGKTFVELGAVAQGAAQRFARRGSGVIPRRRLEDSARRVTSRSEVTTIRRAVGGRGAGAMQTRKRLARLGGPALDPERVIAALARQRGQLGQQGVEFGAARGV